MAVGVGMAQMWQVRCDGCGAQVNKPAGEVRRAQKLGRRLFCSRSCTAKTANAPKRAQPLTMTCPCGQTFQTSTHNKAKRHCSRACASTYSMTEARREAASAAGKRHSKNLCSPSEALRRREGWKYAALAQALGDRPHQFEFELDSFVFDLALLDTKVLVEFDGPDHQDKPTRERDAIKLKVAKRAGWRLERRAVRRLAIIHPESIEGL